MKYLFYFLPILFCLIGTTSIKDGSLCLTVTNETSYKNCLTWRDDQIWLHLKCRVADFILPVTFYHNASNTEVKCRIHKDERGCTPKENFTIDEFTHTVTLVLSEKKTGRDLEGRWYCKQGHSIQKTDVSFLEGIISDPTIYLRGTNGNESQYLNVECSSCRRSKGPYMELLINNKTVATFTHTDKKCLYNGVSCFDSNICECTETQNAFVLRLLLNVNIVTNIMCFMQFYDEFRGITFQVTVSHDYAGQDFWTTGNNSKIVHRKPKPSSPSTLGAVTTQVQPAQSESRQTSTTKEKTFSTNIPQAVKTARIVTPISIVLLSIVLIGAFGYLVKRTWVKWKKITNKNNNNCQSCPTSKAAVSFCFDCYGAFCSGCISDHHDLHITIPVSKFPKLFDFVSFFKCHGDHCYQYVCVDDEKVYCCECENAHAKCNRTEEIVNIEEERVNFLKNKYVEQLPKFESELENYLNWLQTGKQTSKKQKKEFLGRFSGINSLNLSKKMRPYLTDICNFEKEINIMKSKIKTQSTLVRLLHSYAEPWHVLIALVKFQDELSLIKRKIRICKKSFYQQKILKNSDDFTFEVIYLESINENLNQSPDEDMSVLDRPLDTSDTSDTSIEHEVETHYETHQEQSHETSFGASIENQSECTETAEDLDTNENIEMNVTSSDDMPMAILQNRNTESINMNNRYQSPKNISEKKIHAPIKTNTSNNRDTNITPMSTWQISIKNNPLLRQAEDELQSYEWYKTDISKNEHFVPLLANIKQKSDFKVQINPECEPFLLKDAKTFDLNPKNYLN